MNKPKVSVIIPNYNYAKYLGEAVDSALAQTYPNIEVIVVDDGSSDDSRKVIESYGDKIKAVFQQNCGVSTARNNGAEIASGEYLAFLDADDIWRPEKITRQMQRFAESKKTGFVHSSVTLINSKGEKVGEETDGQEGSVADQFLLFERRVAVCPASTGVVPREVFDDIGGFDTQLSTSADWDFCYRLSTKYDIAYVAEPFVLYRMHGSNMHGNIPRMEREMLIGFRKAFDAGAGADKRLCYGNLYKTLAGSYFYAGQYGQFVRHTIKSIWSRPSNLGYFLRFPLRRWNGRLSATPPR